MVLVSRTAPTCSRDITLATSLLGIIHAVMVQGRGFSLLFVPLTTAALARIPRHRLTDATGLNSLLRQVGASIGLAVFATLLDRYGWRARAVLAAHVSAGPARGAGALCPARRRAGPARLRPGLGPDRGPGRAPRRVASQGMVIAFEQVFLLTGIVLLCTLPLLYFLVVKPIPSQRVHVDME